jgi:hypothetical protein
MDEPAADDQGTPADEDRRATGFAPPAPVRVLKAVRVPGSLLLIGIALLFVGPLPGLGFFLVIGAGLATFVIGMTALVGV